MGTPPETTAELICVTFSVALSLAYRAVPRKPGAVTPELIFCCQPAKEQTYCNRDS